MDAVFLRILMAIVVFLHVKTVFFNPKIKIVAFNPIFAAFVAIFMLVILA